MNTQTEWLFAHFLLYVLLTLHCDINNDIIYTLVLFTDRTIMYKHTRLPTNNTQTMVNTHATCPSTLDRTMRDIEKILETINRVENV